jgi:hypothetical protein
MLRWVGHVATTGEMRNIEAFQFKYLKKQDHLEKLCRWEDSFKMILKTECVGVDWIKVAKDRVHHQALVNLQVPEMVGNFLTSRMTISF